MQSDDLQKLAGRVASLEAFNRRLSRLVVILLVVLASVVWMGQRAPAKKKAPAATSTPKVLEAEAFLLKSASGQVTASLSATTGGPTLRLLGPNGTERAALALDNTGAPRLALNSATGKSVYSVTLDKDGYPAVEIGAADAPKLLLVVGAAGPGIGMLDADGVARLGLDLKADGPVVALTAKDKTDLLTLSGTEKGPTVALADPEGHPRITFTVRPDQAVFGIRDTRGDVRVGLEVRAENPALGLYGPNGKALFVKP
jgi:hypothetical protein